MKNYNINLDKGVYINNILIDEDIFREEKVGYSPVDRKDQINDLYMWIGEAINDEKRSSDVYMMKEDLHYLESIKDEIVFSAIGTNEFIAKSDDEETFNSICEEILEINEILNLKLTDRQKEELRTMYNKSENKSNLVTLQTHFKKDSHQSKVCLALKKKGLVCWVGTGLRFAVSYPTEKGIKAIEILKLNEEQDE